MVKNMVDAGAMNDLKLASVFECKYGSFGDFGGLQKVTHSGRSCSLLYS